VRNARQPASVFLVERSATAFGVDLAFL